VNGDGVRLGRLTAVGLAIASAVALWDTEFHVVPAAAGLWRGVADVPNSLRILVALLAGAALAYRLRHQPWPVTRPLLWLGLAAAPLVPILSGRASALIAFQRPALALVCAAALAASVARALGARPHAPGSGAAPPAPARRARAFPLREAVLGALAFAFFAWLGRHLPGPAGPQGDEPHYLVQAQSLLSDGDLDLDDEFTQREYRAFFGGTLDAHASPSSPRGTLYSVHTPGLPALLLPAYALQGYRGAQLFVSLLAALTGALVHRLVRDATGQAGLALAAWAVLTCVPPLPLYAVSIYPEVVAAPATALFLLTSRRDPGRLALAGAALAAAALPWMHPKFLPLAALGLGLTVARRGPRAWRAGAVLAFALSLAALFAFFYALYGRASLAAAYGPRLASDVSLARLPWGLLGLLLDRQFGLFVVSPAWALALPGLALVARQRTGDALRALLLAGATLGVGASYGMWWGGACPPGRFVVPALPAFALGLACAARRRPAVAAALGGAGACVLMLAAQTPHALHNRADGESGLLRLLAPALDLDGSLPSFVVGGGEAALLGLTLLAAFALAWSRGARGLLAAGLAYALLAGALRERPPPSAACWTPGTRRACGRCRARSTCPR
jgi:hypothetical protein